MPKINMFIQADDNTHYYLLSTGTGTPNLPKEGEVILTNSVCLADLKPVDLDFTIVNIAHCSRYKNSDVRRDGIDVIVVPCNTKTEDWCEETIKAIFNDK